MGRYNISNNDSMEIDVIYGSSGEWKNFYNQEDYAYFVFVSILSVIEIPVMILTLTALFSLVKSRPAASVFVGHLIFSDLIQVIYMLIKTAISWSFKLDTAYYYSLIVSVYFMACVAFERYLLVSHPVWYKSHQSLKLSCFISVLVWFVPLTCAEIDPPNIYFDSLYTSIACLIPYIIILLCFAGTWRGLSRSISLTALKRKLILGSLFLVLLTYTFLILPFVIMLLISDYYYFYSFFIMKCYTYTRLLLYVSPLADCLLYLFMRPDVGDLMKSVQCCCRHQSCKHNQDEHSVAVHTSTVMYSISAQKPASHSSNTWSSVEPADK